MSDLVAFLTARLDEDEAVARDAAHQLFDDTEWMTDEPGSVMTDRGGAAVATTSKSRQSTAAHIVRHDPARVMAEVAAKRAVLLMHPVPDPARDSGHCCTDPDDPHLGEEMYWTDPCPTVLAVVSVYADHPDFDPAWRT